MASDESYLAVLKASYDYDPQPDAEEELAIKEDQLLFLLERSDDDWWKVKIKVDNDEEGPSGLVPAAYVETVPHTTVVKALYDYDAAQPGELTVKEDEILYVYDKDDDWWLVSTAEGGKVGYVPGNYCGEEGEEGETAPSTGTVLRASQIVIPDSPPRPAYVDPADRVASNKAQADDIKTWSISEVDKKGKKKKGTLGVGNGAIFFASESDKTPVQKWQTSDVSSFKIEKSKHVHIDIGGSTPVDLHFHAGSKDVAEEIVAKLESSRALSKPPSSTPPSLAPTQEPIERPRSSAKSVHFDAAEPEIIPLPPPTTYVEDDDEPEPEPVHEHNEEPIDHTGGDPAIALYDFAADGEDELSVREGEALIVLERDSDEWWKVKNGDGLEGVVPASYVELLPGAKETVTAASHEDDDVAAAAREAEEAAARAEVERANAASKAAAEKERKEKERKKQEAEQRAKAAAVAAEADRRRREQERERQKEKEKAAAAAAEEERNKKPQEESSKSSRKSNGDASGSRSSVDKRGPPTSNVRTWHDRSGQFRVDAAFLGYANGKLRLHKINGVVIEVPAEKMSPEDVGYVEKLMNKPSSSGPKSDDDDEPLESRRRSLQPSASASRSSPPAKKKPTVDWFEFFLNAGCDVDDCTRYASSFERDKIDEAILPDITDSTMRSLGLREGDIIRVQKLISQRHPKQDKQEQIRRDEELAKQLQAEDSGKRGPAPNLFAGPNGALKNSVRRGRPQPSKSLPPPTVDLAAITTAGTQIQRSSTPLVSSPGTPSSSASPAPPVQAPARTSSAVATVSGFDDDAWTNRPSSTRPIAPTPPAVAPRAPSAPPAPMPPLAPTPPVSAPAPAPPAPAPIALAASSPPATTLPAASQPTGSNLANTTESDIFNQLARLSQLRVQAPVPPAPSPLAVPTVSPPPRSYTQGMGMGSSPAPMGQHLQAQQTGILQPPQFQNGPRGPFAPVPANQSLLQPLVPTSTGFNSFIPTRPQSTPAYQQPYQQPAFLSAQPTGFGGPSPAQPLLPQQTGFVNPGPILPQATGMMTGNFGGYGGNMNGIPPVPPLPTNTGYGQMQSTPTGFNPGFGQSPFNNPLPASPPAPPQNNTNPANIFAAMKSGTFASDNISAPQSSDKYDALRPNPILTAQPTGWGYQGMNGMPGGYGFQH